MQIMRKRARRYIGKGVVTSGDAPDRETVINSLYEALATEIACELRYQHRNLKVATANAAPSHAEYVDLATSDALNKLRTMINADRTAVESDRETAGYRFEQDPTTRLLDEMLAEAERMPGTLGSA